MEVVVYRIKVKGSYTYDLSFDPRIDYTYLSKDAGIEEMEVITPFIPVYMGKFILRILIRTLKTTSLFNPFKHRAIDKVLKRLNVERVSNIISESIDLPSDIKKECLLNIIGDGVTYVDSLEEKILPKMTSKDMYACLQVLHLEKKIKINPIYGKRGKTEYCDICDESCEDCFLGFSSSDIVIYKVEGRGDAESTSIHYKKARICDDFIEYIDKVSEFYNSRRDNLVVLCSPMYKDIGFAYGAIYNCLKSSGRVLYITSPLCVDTVKGCLDKVLDGAGVVLFDGVTSFSDANVLVCCYTNMPAFKDDFELVVLDDRVSVVNRPYKNIFSICNRALKPKGKFINISIVPLKYKENLLKGSSEEIPIPPMNIKNPIPEPKFIISRYIDERTVYLPDISLDLVKWSLREGSKVIIFTPSNRISIQLKNYLTKVEGVSTSVGISSDKSREDYFEFINSNKDILISSNYLDCLESVYNINVIVMYSDSDKYSDDVLVYMCNMANNHTMNTFREALFIANSEEENMNRAKSIIRSINKVAWENGYIRD
ncbi:MAG: hypothetical protein RSA01_05365 [Clostridium sp.]